MKNLFKPDSGLIIIMTQATDCIFSAFAFLMGCVPVVRSERPSSVTRYLLPGFCCSRQVRRSDPLKRKPWSAQWPWVLESPRQRICYFAAALLDHIK